MAKKPTQADVLLNSALNELGLSNASDEVKYRNIDSIVARLQKFNDLETIPVSTTGTITQRLCEFGLRAASIPHGTLPRGWAWLGDYWLRGNPLNVFISVKSFVTKERLLASGSGNILAPMLGWGLFKDPTEFTPDRLRQYKFKAFFAIYVPDSFYPELGEEARKVQNQNGNAFLRRHNDLLTDIKRALSKSDGNAVDALKL